MESINQAQLLAAVITGIRRRLRNALVSDLYPLLFIEEGFIYGSVSTDSIKRHTLIYEVPIISGSVLVDEILQISVVIPHTETEKEITGSVSVDSIEQNVVLISHTETEKEITGSVSVLSIDQVEVLISRTEIEKEITGSVSIDSITKV